MKKVLIQIPTLEAEQNIEIDIKINGKRKTLQYRIELVEWDNKAPSTEERVDTIRRAIQDHERDWKLVQIGAPTDESIPIMFMKREVEVPA